MKHFFISLLATCCVIALLFGAKYLFEHMDNNSIILDQLSGAQATVNAPSPTLTETPSPTPTIEKKQLVLYDVPFTSQSPFAEWSDPRQQDACEEASILMAMHWVKGEPISSKQVAKTEILAISAYQKETFKEFRDTSAADAAKWIIEGYYQYKNYEVKELGSAEEIIEQLDRGNLIVVPTNGQALHNSHFKQPGPERHMLTIKGYDREKEEFITNDPGIKEGEGWRYTKDVLFNAIRDYATGYHIPIKGTEKVMIVVKK